MRYDVKYKLTQYLDYFYNTDELVRNNNLLFRYSQVLTNIGHVEALGIVFVDRQVSKN